MAERHARLERLAVEVPDLEAWIAAFELLLGPGYRRSAVTVAGGEIDFALHSGGVELVSTPGRGPRLRSFHLRVPDLDAAVSQVERLGWREVDRFVVDGRTQVVVDAGGLRLILLAPRPEAGDGT
jgi:hypothetical protein